MKSQPYIGSEKIPEKELDSDVVLDCEDSFEFEDEEVITGETLKVKLINSFEEDACCLVTLHDHILKKTAILVIQNLTGNFRDGYNVHGQAQSL